MTTSQHESKGLLLGASAVLLWATSASCMLWIGRRLGVWQFLALGSLIGAAGQFVAYRALGRDPRRLLILPGRLWAVAVLGFVFYAACLVSGLVSAKTDAQAVGVALMNHLWPVLTVVFAVALVPGTRLSGRLLAALALALVGLACANGDAVLRARSNGAGLPLFLGGLAGVSWALYSALIARWRDWARNHATAPAGFLMSSALGFGMCAIRGEWHPVELPTGLALLYLGLGPNAAGYLLWENALHRAPVATLGLMAAATPVLSTLCLFGLMCLAGPVRALPARWPVLLAGAALIAAAVVLSFVRLRPAARSAA